MFQNFAIQQAIGIVGRIAAAVPLVLVTILLARTQGLVQAGQFAVALGFSTLTFAPAGWGFRSHIVIDRLSQFSPREYIHARGLMICGATAATLLAGTIAGVPLTLNAAVVLFRSCDLIIDLDQAFNLTRRETQYVMTRFAAAHSAKLALLLAAGAIAFLLRFPADILVLAVGLIAAAAAGHVLLLDLSSDPRPPHAEARVWSLLNRSKWFAASEIGAAAILSAPRSLLPWLYSGPLLGTVGISLTVAGFFWMAFSTTWLRFLSMHAANTENRNSVYRFLLEIILIAAVCSLASWLILPELMAAIFGFHGGVDIGLSRNVLLASVAFFGGLSLANIYKITGHAWIESLAYLAGIAITAGAVWQFPALRDTPSILTFMGVLLFASSIPAVARSMRKGPASV